MNRLIKTTIFGILAGVMAAPLAHASAIFAFDADDTTVAASSFPSVWDPLVFSNPADVSVFQQSSTGNGDGDGNFDSDIDTAAGLAWGLHAGIQNLVGPSEVRVGNTLQGGALGIGQTLSIDMDNGFIGSGVVGIELDAGGFDRFIFQFSGGAFNYEYGTIGGGYQDSGISFTDEGLGLSFTLVDANTIDLQVTTYADGNTMDFNGLALGNSGGIDRIEIFNRAAGDGASNDAFFNNLAVVPEPGTAALLVLGLGGLIARRRRG